MKILSLLQPWATLLVQGHKLIETRSFQTHYRGPLFIHASGSLAKKYKESDYSPATMSLEPGFREFIPDASKLPFGKIIGAAEIVSVLDTEDVRKQITSKEWRFGDYGPNRFAWQTCSNVEFVNFTPHKGELGIRDCKTPTLCPICDSGKIPFFDRVGMYLHKTPDGFAECKNMLAVPMPELKSHYFLGVDEANSVKNILN